MNKKEVEAVVALLFAWEDRARMVIYERSTDIDEDFEKLKIEKRKWMKTFGLTYPDTGV